MTLIGFIFSNMKYFLSMHYSMLIGLKAYVVVQSSTGSLYRDNFGYLMWASTYEMTDCLAFMNCNFK